MKIEQLEELSENLEKFINMGFSEYADKNGVSCNYTPFYFVAYENNEVSGILTGKSLYNEVHIEELIVHERYRGMDIGTRLLEVCENSFRNKGFRSISLTTFAFQAPEFYKKCGYQIEFIREDKKNPRLTKYFFIKYMDN